MREAAWAHCQIAARRSKGNSFQRALLKRPSAWLFMMKEEIAANGRFAT
jgi:hypothetical protein